MINPAYLVEGDLEQRFVQNACPNQPVQKIGLNGRSVSVSALAKRIATQARLLQKKYHPLIIIFDREEREKTCDNIEKELRDLLEFEDIQAELLIGIADREIENWILADWEVFANCCGCTIEEPPSDLEGSLGKRKVKQFLSKGRSYTETIEGCAWLKKCRPSKIAAQSPSFAKFFANLEQLDCWWFEREV
jgi:hypothetical protein